MIKILTFEDTMAYELSGPSEKIKIKCECPQVTAEKWCFTLVSIDQYFDKSKLCSCHETCESSGDIIASDIDDAKEHNEKFPHSNDVFSIFPSIKDSHCNTSIHSEFQVSIYSRIHSNKPSLSSHQSWNKNNVNPCVAIDIKKKDKKTKT